MCLIGLALDAHPRWSVVIAANRDEYFDRPSAGIDWWQPSQGSSWLLAGRDLAAGGTWMGLSDSGRIGLLTNVRDPSRHRPDAPSRGALVTSWLGAAADGSVRGQVNPFNLIGGDLRSHRWWWASDSQADPVALRAGVHGLSNAALDTPWPKVRRLKARLADALGSIDDVQALTAALMSALADRSVAPDGELPDTGIGLDRERLLSSSFIAVPDGRYGTRCSTVLLGERRAQGWTLAITERSFDARGRALEERAIELVDWPIVDARPPVTARRIS
jgi:uncharacterized protein with NRDE domain